MSYRAVLFDLDGTLLNTLQDLTDALNHTLTAHGFAPYSSANVRLMLGNGMHNLVKQALPDGTDDETLDVILTEFIGYYRPHCMDNTCPYEGIPEMLKAVKATGADMFVISNKNEQETKILISEVFGEKLFTGVFGTVAWRKRKPAPDSCLAALESIGCPASEALFVGDSEVDAETAQNAGIYEVGVTWGFRGIDVLQKAGVPETVDTPEELAARLTALLQG